MASGIPLDDADAALDALQQVMADGAFAIPDDGEILFLRARPGAALHAFAPQRLICVQSLRPHAQELERQGLIVSAEIPDRRFPLVLVLPPRQRDEARALLAHAVAHTQPGGRVVAAMANHSGARSGERDLEQLTGPLQHASRRKCRVFWTAPLDGPADAELHQQWLRLDAPTPILDGRFVSRPGLFAWDRIDPASAMLAAQLPDTLSGRVADLGAGYGFLSTEILRRCPQVTALDLYEAEGRALEPARINMENTRTACASTASVAVHWHDVACGLPHRYDAIVSNPPFHLDRADRPELGQAFIRAAGEALVPGGRLFMVANRHLPYEATLANHFSRIHVLDQAHGFKVIEAERGHGRARS
jgi:16S rRNA (guanine1207-N2)-methyltransferase